jgi:site-specific recombinase XerD
MKTSSLTDLLTRYFSEHLRQHRNVSRHTVAAYRDTFRLLLRFFKQTYRTPPATLELRELNAPRVLAFLTHLEEVRHNGIRSRNARLAAIRAFVHYVEDRLGPDLPEASRRILAIPLKRYTKPILGFLTRPEVEALLAATGQNWTGRRDHLLFLLLYNTGARVSEVLNLRVRDVLTADYRHLTLHGKGRKERTVPLWRNTQTQLRQWIKENHLESGAPLLPNRFGQPLTRSGVAWQLRQLVGRAARQVPSLQQRRLSPHTFRHTTAMHLLQGGVSPEVIALWLGHESPNTTHLYIEADLTMKRQALEVLAPPKGKRSPTVGSDPLLRFLEDL